MKTAFIGLDYIADIICPAGKLANSAAHAAERGIIAKANQLLSKAQAEGWLSVLVKVGFAEGYIDQPKHSPFFGRAHEIGALKFGGSGLEFHPDLHANLADAVIVKPRVNAFYGTGLEAILRANKIERLIIAGVSSVWAVQSTVRDAHDRDYEVVVIEDACAAGNQAEHEESMKVLGAIAKIIKIEDLAA
ncbi:cysteine hydrolase family protein [Pseudomonas sp. MDT1-85]